MLTTSALTPEIPLPSVFLTVAVKNIASPVVSPFASEEPVGISGASVVKKGPG